MTACEAVSHGHDAAMRGSRVTGDDRFNVLVVTFTDSTGIKLVGIAVARAHHPNPGYKGHAPFWPPARLAVSELVSMYPAFAWGLKLKLIYINNSLDEL